VENVLLYDLDTVRRVDVNWSLPEPWLHWQAKMDRLENEQRRWLLLAATVLMLGVVTAAHGISNPMTPRCWHRRRFRSGAPHVLLLGDALSTATVSATDGGRWSGWMAINLGLFVLHRFTPSFEMIYGVMSWALLAYFLIWLGPEAYRTLRQRSQPS
jgi:hypothetical protein